MALVDVWTSYWILEDHDAMWQLSENTAYQPGAPFTNMV